MLDLNNIKKFRSSTASYRVNPMFDYLQFAIDGYKESFDFEMNPDFQRGHVWTEEQQIAYLEFIMRGGTSGLTIYFNCPYFGGNKNGGDLKNDSMVVVDGLQRLTALLKFENNELPIFDGHFRKDVEHIPFINLTFAINGLNNRKDLLEWYLELNEAGTPHTTEELNKVRRMLDSI